MTTLSGRDRGQHRVFVLQLHEPYLGPADQVSVAPSRLHSLPESSSPVYCVVFSGGTDEKGCTHLVDSALFTRSQAQGLNVMPAYF